ncbi:MAG: choice-of-anchor D domain-containing protein, partial [Terracidiphilus sp.]
TLNGGSTCTAQIAFDPKANGGIAATLTVSSSTLGVNPASVTLSGTAELASGLNASPVQIDFAAVNPGQTTPAQTVTVTNATNFSIASITIAVSPPFVLTQNNCTGSLAVGAQCTAAVAFAPATQGGATGTLTVSSPDVATPASVALIGSGGIQVGPASIGFPTTGVGMTSSPTTVTVKNLSATDALSGLSIGVTTGFQVISNTCGATLAPQASCTAGVEFAPAAGGRQTGSLTVMSNTVSAGPIALSGMGFDFTAAISGSPSQTVASGQDATYALVLSAVNGSQGMVSFQCSSLPADAACVFNPATAAVGGGAQSNATVAISTGDATASAHEGGAPWRAVPLLACVLLLPMAGRRRRGLAIAALLAAVVCFGAVACTSSGGGGGAGPVGGSGNGGTTPAGTYSIQIAAGGAGVQHAVTVTLTVD